MKHYNCEVKSIVFNLCCTVGGDLVYTEEREADGLNDSCSSDGCCPLVTK